VLDHQIQVQLKKYGQDDFKLTASGFQFDNDGVPERLLQAQRVLQREVEHIDDAKTESYPR
jgi:hypothetical protein